MREKTLKRKLLLLITTLLMLFISVVGLPATDSTSQTTLKIPAKLGIQKIDIEKNIKVDGKNYPFTFLDGMLLADGTRKITIDNRTYTIQVKTMPDPVKADGSVEYYTFVLEGTATFYDPTVRELKTVAASKEMSISEKMYIGVIKDDFGNISDVAFVPPTLEKLDILDSQNPISNISGRKFLLSSKSPYRIISRTIIPENSALILENGVTLINSLNAELNIKGSLVTTGPATILGSGTLSVSGSGILYASVLGTELKVTSDRGALVFLDNSDILDMNLVMPNFVVIRNSSLRSAKINGAYAVYIIDSNITELEVKNCGNVIINNSSIGKMDLGMVSKVVAYSSGFSTLNISDLSVMALVSSKVNTVSTDRGGVIKAKNSEFGTIALQNYSIAYLYKSSSQTLSVENSKYYNLESKIGKVIK
ncbi:hypothetical protein [Fervidobacterium gondwanense]|uniref:Right handed beta helix region n=1 Tax=Fervidobacterium gondwanense DSM 13020 TaxID=1121883 RepID=A0A1M7TEX6_FERGO|nr:hypothetical protein [Fervidobacterium gondwanense]SHN69218.1 hypothetical protein SAMN02745226_01921 [Fervidobacterium gondwanense DSM 13020]